jgi:TonB-linked SusC/RagA family outer membrane protein
MLKYLHRYIGCIILVFLVSLPSNAWSLQQGQTVTGKIITSEDGTALPGVNIVEKGTTNGTITDLQGNYSLTVGDQDAVLVFSLVGFEAQEQTVGNQTVISVTLLLDIQSLDEVVVVGYGTQMKSELTGSVVSIPKERLEKLQFNNFANAIQGSMPGVSVTAGGGGAEGNDVVLLVRGRNSITADIEPLIILDGIPYTGSYSSINPSDIQSIEVLKDASASAIYGSRGSNGVILITSKKGQAGEMVVNAEVRYGIRRVNNLPDIMTGTQFYDAKIFYDPLKGVDLSEEAIHNSDNPDGTDWLEQATRNGSKFNAGLSLRGGAENVNYFISLNHLNVTGVSVGDDFSRESFRLNMEAKHKDWLTFGSNNQIIAADRSGVETDFDDALWMNPLSTPYDEEGNLIMYPYPEDIYFRNPIGPTLYEDDNKSFDLFTNNYLELRIPGVKGLQYKLNTGVELSTTSHSQYRGRNTPIGSENNGDASVDNRRKTNVVVENLLTYHNSFGAHNIGLTGLYSFQETIYNRDGVSSSGFESDVLTWYQISLGGGIDPNQGYSNTALLSWMGRLNYDYAKKYYLTFTIRSDGYSGFGEDTKWGTFPSVALSWNLKNEDFLANSNFVNQLKMRLSYGINGNQAVGPYQTMSRMGTRNEDNRGHGWNYYYIDGSTTLPGFIPVVLGAPTLGWEETATWNVGLDFLLGSFLQGTVDLYNANTERLLLERSISPTLGIPSIIDNIGEVNNQGIELGLTGYIISGRDLQWNVSFVGSFVKNEIIALYGSGGDDIANKWFIGEPITSNYDYIFDGIIQTPEQADEYMALLPAETGVLPGVAKVKDLDSNGVIDDEDRDLIGKTDPNVHLGISSSVSYKGINLYFLFQGVYGSTKPNVALYEDHWGYRRNTTFKEWWTPENGSNTIPANAKGSNPYNTGFYRKANFWRLKDVMLSYNLPSSLLNKVGINGIRVFIQGTNLATITDWFGMDPEFETDPSIGEDVSDQEEFLPLQKEIAFGISVNF